MTGCCKAFFTLECFGINVRVLECPLTKWVSEGRPTSSEKTAESRPAASESDYIFKLDSSKIANFEDLNSGKLFDARPASAFEQGSIPNATSLPFGMTLTADKCFKPLAEV